LILANKKARFWPVIGQRQKADWSTLDRPVVAQRTGPVIEQRQKADKPAVEQRTAVSQ